MLSQELFFLGVHAAGALRSVAVGSGMAARATGHVHRTDLLFHSDYADLFMMRQKNTCHSMGCSSASSCLSSFSV